MLLEAELIQKCICGDRLAQKELYERYSPTLFAVCVRYMPTKEEAEDVLIMGFTYIFTKMNSYKNEGSFEGWMRRIIINTAIDTLRVNNKHYEMINDSNEWSDNNILISENMIYSQMNFKDIIKQIAQMPMGYRTVFNLYVIEGYSYEEISNILGIALGTVKSQLAKARKLLQKKLQIFSYDNEQF